MESFPGCVDEFVKSGKPMPYEQRRRVVEFLDEGIPVAEVARRCSCSYKHAQRIKDDIARQNLLRDAAGNHIGAPVPAQQGGYRYSRMNADQQIACAQLAVENPRYTIEQIRAEVLSRFPGLVVSAATIRRTLDRAQLSFMRAVLKDPRRDSTLAHVEENTKFAEEQNKGESGVLNSEHLFFMDETNVYLNEQVKRAWGVRGTAGADVRKSKGKTMSVSLYAGIGLVPAPHANKDTWAKSVNQSLEAHLRNRVSDTELFRGNHILKGEHDEWQSANAPPTFALTWWVRPPQRASSVLGPFVTGEDVRSESFTVTFDNDPKFESFFHEDGNIDLHKVKKFVSLFPLQIFESTHDAQQCKLAYEGGKYSIQSDADSEFSFECNVSIVKDLPAPDDELRLTPTSHVQIFNTRTDNMCFIKNTVDLPAYLVDTTALRLFTYYNNIEWREVDENGDLQNSGDLDGESDRLRERFFALQSLVAKEYRLYESDPAAKFIYVFRGKVDYPVPRAYFTAFGRQTKGGALDSVHGDKAMFLRYLAHVVDYYKLNFDPAVRNELVMAWDSAPSHGQVEVTSDKKSWIHDVMRARFGVRGCVFLPVRQPEFNPVELLFAYIKGSIRRRSVSVIGELSVEGTIQMIDSAFREVTHKMAQGWIANGCYHVKGRSQNASCQLRFDKLMPSAESISESKKEILSDLCRSISVSTIQKLLALETDKFQKKISLVSRTEDDFPTGDFYDVDGIVRHEGKEWSLFDNENATAGELSPESLLIVTLQDDSQCVVPNLKSEYHPIRNYLSMFYDGKATMFAYQIWLLARNRPLFDPSVAVALQISDELYGHDFPLKKMHLLSETALDYAKTKDVATAVRVIINQTQEASNLLHDVGFDSLLHTVYKPSLTALEADDTLGKAVVALHAYEHEKKRALTLEGSAIREVAKDDDTLQIRLTGLLSIYKRTTDASVHQKSQVAIDSDTGERVQLGLPGSINLHATALAPFIDVRRMRMAVAQTRLRRDESRVANAIDKGDDIPRRWPGYPLPDPLKDVGGKTAFLREAASSIRRRLVNKTDQYILKFKRPFDPLLYNDQTVDVDNFEIVKTDIFSCKLTLSLKDTESKEALMVCFTWTDSSPSIIKRLAPADYPHNMKIAIRRDIKNEPKYTLASFVPDGGVEIDPLEPNVLILVDSYYYATTSATTSATTRATTSASNDAQFALLKIMVPQSTLTIKFGRYVYRLVNPPYRTVTILHSKADVHPLFDSNLAFHNYKSKQLEDERYDLNEAKRRKLENIRREV